MKKPNLSTVINVANREKPRFAIIGFTLNRELITNNLTRLKVHLNSD